MRVILAYDVQTKRLKKVRRICLRYLTATQRSVFEGVLTEKQYTILTSDLTQAIDQGYDAVTLYRIYPGHSFLREDLGIQTTIHHIL